MVSVMMPPVLEMSNNRLKTTLIYRLKKKNKQFNVLLSILNVCRLKNLLIFELTTAKQQPKLRNVFPSI